jgi:hypothetical protein
LASFLTPTISAKGIILEVIQFGIFPWLAFINRRFDYFSLTIIQFFAFLLAMVLFSSNSLITV